MEQPLSLRRSDDPAYQWEQLYQFFVNAQETHTLITSVSIQQHWSTVAGERIDLDRVRWHMDRYWRWLLFYVNDGARPYHYEVRHIKNYPPDYFVQAHRNHSRMQYLAHFVQSIDQDKARRRRATGHPRASRPAAATPTIQVEPTFNQEESLFGEDKDSLFGEIEIQSEVQAEDEDLIPEEDEVSEQRLENTATEHQESQELQGLQERPEQLENTSDGGDSEMEAESHEPPHEHPHQEQPQEQPPALITAAPASVEQGVASQQHTPHRLWLLLTAGIAVIVAIVAAVAYFLLTRSSR
jgi:hypothetical protein